MAFEDRRGKGKEEKTMSYLKFSSSDIPTVAHADLKKLSFSLGQTPLEELKAIVISLEVCGSCKEMSLWLIMELWTFKP